MTEPVRWSLTLYVNGASSRSAAAIEAVRTLCAQDLAGRADLQIVDVHDAAERAASDGVSAVPTLVKRLPAPLRRLVGGLDDVQRLRTGLDLDLDQSPVRAGPDQTPRES